VLFDQDLTESDHAVNRSQEDWIGSKTRSQAVARIADRTAAQHRPRDHLKVRLPFPIGGPLELEPTTKPLSLTVSEIFNGECDVMVEMTLNDL